MSITEMALSPSGVGLILGLWLLKAAVGVAIWRARQARLKVKA